MYYLLQICIIISIGNHEGSYQSGQMERTVNPLSSTSVVRIHHCPQINLLISPDSHRDADVLIGVLLNFDVPSISKLGNQHIGTLTSGSSSIGRAIAFQAIGREFETRLPLLKSLPYQ